MLDGFGNEIDPIVGYARGRILAETDLAENDRFGRKVARAEALVRARAAAGGAFHILTGNRADFPLRPDDLGVWCDGWIGPALAVRLVHMRFRQTPLAPLDPPEAVAGRRAGPRGRRAAGGHRRRDPHPSVYHAA